MNLKWWLHRIVFLRWWTGCGGEGYVETAAEKWRVCRKTGCH